MIRIVGVQRNDIAEREFVLLQNQGNLRANLRGHSIVSDQSIESCDLSRFAHIFSDDALIPAGMYVLLVTGSGRPRWSQTKDGALVYYAYMNREDPVWQNSPGALHMLAPQHTYADRGPALVLR